jgi:hypothetical protein
MTSLNPLSVRAFVAHQQLQRKTRARFRVAIGILLSLLLHGGLLWYVLSVAPLPIREGTTSAIDAPLMITLQQSKPVPSANAPSPNPPEPVRTSKAPAPRPQKAIKRTETKPTPRPTAPRLPQAPSAEPAPPTADMSSMLDAARARRQQAEQSESSDDVVARENNKPPSGNEVAQANIDFSMHRNGGAGGVFQILSIGPRVGIFRFVGWTGEPSNNTRRTFTVDAGLGGDVQMAIIVRMIEMIREHYKEDFKWDSSRVGRTVTLSARKADEAGLREFLKKEFFEDQRY